MRKTVRDKEGHYLTTKSQFFKNKEQSQKCKHIMERQTTPGRNDRTAREGEEPALWLEGSPLHCQKWTGPADRKSVRMWLNPTAPSITGQNDTYGPLHPSAADSAPFSRLRGTAATLWAMTLGRSEGPRCPGCPPHLARRPSEHRTKPPGLSEKPALT